MLSKSISASVQPNTENSYDLQSMPTIAAKLMQSELVHLLCFALIPVVVLASLTFMVVGNNLAAQKKAEDIAHIQYVQSQMDFIISELDSLNLTFCVNSEISRTLARAFDLNDSQAIISLKRICYNYMIPTVAAHDYIHSMYFYSDNSQGMFLTSGGNAVGPVLLSQYGDSSWMDGYQQMLANELDFFAQHRQFKEYSFESEPLNIITLYRRLYLRNGVIVLNLHQDYFDGMLSSKTTSDSQVLLVANEHHEMIMQGGGSVTFTPEEMIRLCTAADQELQATTVGGQKWLVTRMPSGNRYNWTYLSLTPMNEAYAFSRNMFLILGLIFVPTVLVCIIVAWRHSKRYCQNAMRLLHTLEAAERHEAELTQSEVAREDFYGMVTQRIVQNYAERNNLRYQLEQKLRSARDLELCALRSQINPHFLFNTLKSIYWMSFSQFGGPNEVSKMIENMTEILEYSLDASDDLASLADEIRNTKAYVDIQHMRYKERFVVEWRYDPELEKYYTVKMLLQPLVENAIIHGIRWTETKQLHITIVLEKRDDYIELTIIDDGVGIPQQQLEKIVSRLNSHSDEGHIGLYSCNKRLCLTFGEECGVRIESSEGTRIALRFPCLMNEMRI